MDMNRGSPVHGRESPLLRFGLFLMTLGIERFIRFSIISVRY